MLKTTTRTPSGRVLGLSLLAALALAAVPAAADQTYVLEADFSGGGGSGGALFRVNAISGNRSLVSDFSNPAQGPLGFFPSGLALKAGGTVLVIDRGAGVGGILFRVDPATGNRSVVSDFGNAFQGPLGFEPVGLALEAAGTVLVIDQSSGTERRGALFRVDPISGHRSLVSDFGNPAQGPLSSLPVGLVLEAAGTVLVIDRFPLGTGTGALFRVKPASGNRRLVSDFGNPAQGPLGSFPSGLALEASGTVLVIDPFAGTFGVGALFRVDRLSGQREMVSDFGDQRQGEIGIRPLGVAVVVPRCFGRVPTVVGDNGNNVLIGSPRADVILGRAGDDLIAGRGGNDRICGGDGNDILRGGTGNDRLAGGKGRDRLNGGKGRDRCKSGEVKVGCER